MSVIYTAPPTLARFMKSEAFGRICAGPVGSGKTTACVMEMLRRAMTQARADDGYRYSRFAIVRQTLKQLKDTVLKDCQAWLSPVLGEWKVSENTYLLEFGDVKSEWIFVPLENAEDQARLLSMQLTGAWLSEAIEMNFDVLAPITGRIGRYPSAGRGTPSWLGVIADTNMPMEMSDWHKLMLEPPPNWQVFIQPGGMTAEAENLNNLLQTEETARLPINHPARLAQGRRYYERFVEMYGSGSPWVRRYVDAQYGDDPSGEAVFKASFKPSFHVVPDTFVIPGYPLIVGIDFGRNPWALIGQVDHIGRLLVHMEVPASNIGLEKHVEQNLRPKLMGERFIGSKVILVGDPSGVAKGTIAEETCFDALKRLGLPAFPAPTNDIDARLRAVEALLGRQVNGGPALMISRAGCPFLVRAMSGGYRYKKHRDGGLRSVPEKFDREGFSHVCFVAGTKIATPDGEQPIETLAVGDLVNTPLGPRCVVATGNRISYTVRYQCSNDTRIRCTPDHPFWTQRGWVAARDLTRADTCFARSKSSRRQHDAGPKIQSTNSKVSDITKAAVIGTMLQAARDFIERSGNAISARSRQAATSIIRMATAATTSLITWNAYLRVSTAERICLSLPGSKNPEPPSSSPSWLLQTSGTRTRHGPARSIGRPEWPWLQSLRSSPNGPSNASTAAALTKHIPAAASEASARPHARPQHDGPAAWMTKFVRVVNVAGHSGVINTRGLSTAHVVAAGSPRQERVYNITVAEAHCYFANGMLVANCDALQYMACVVHGGLVHEFARRLTPRPKIDRARISAAGWT